MKILLKESQISYLLQEALSLDQAKAALKIQRSPETTQKIDDIFSRIKQKYPNFRTSKRGDRLYIPYGSSLESEIKKVLSDVKYKSSGDSQDNKDKYVLKSFENGVVLDTEYNRDIKLGKVLTKIGHEDLLIRYTTNKSKGVKDSSSGFIVFSKHHYDIAGMSTGRDWTSCMNLETGSNRHYISCDITEGSFVLYLIDKNDLNITKPLGRILIKPFININDINDVIFFPEDRTYGSIPIELQQEIKNLFNEFNADTKGIMYSKNEKLYNDSISRNFTNLNKIKSFADIENLVFNINDNEKEEFAQKSELIKDYIMRSKRISPYVKENIINNSTYLEIEKYLTPEFLSKDITTRGLDNLIERFPQVKNIISQNFKLFEKNNSIAALLKYFPERITKISFKVLNNLNENEIFRIFYYNPVMFAYLYPKFKDKIKQSTLKLTYFLEENPKYITMSYPIFKPILKNMNMFERYKFISHSLYNYPPIFNFYLNNNKELLDNFFSMQTSYNYVITKNNSLFYLAHTYYPDFVKKLVNNDSLNIFNFNKKLIDFILKNYKDSFLSLNPYDLFRLLYSNPENIPIVIRYIPDIVRKIGKNYLIRLSNLYTEYKDELSKLY